MPVRRSGLALATMAIAGVYAIPLLTAQAAAPHHPGTHHVRTATSASVASVHHVSALAAFAGSGPSDWPPLVS